MRIVRRLLLALLVLVVIALVGGYWYARPLLLTGTGYAAHNACAVSLVAGRDNPATDLPPNPLVPYLRTKIVDDGKTGDSSILGLLAAQHAYFTPGLGCTVAAARPEFAAVAAPQGEPFEAGQPVAVPALEAALDRAFGKDLDASARTALGTRGIVVVKAGKVIAERYADGFSADTPQLGWSMTKSVASLMTGVLNQQGKVALTDAALVPGWTGDKAAITVEDLLRMRSGLAWDETYDLGTSITQMLYAEPDMAAFVAAQPLAHAPGTHLQYSSGSTNLLCSVLAGKAGGDPETLATTTVLGPLGLSHATLEVDASGSPVCSSYLWATPREWAAIGQLALDDGVWKGTRLLPAGWIAATTTATQAAEIEDPGYAAGWWSNKGADGAQLDPVLPADAYQARGHDGQSITVVPSADLVVVRLGFTPAAKDKRVSQLVHDLVAAAG